MKNLENTTIIFFDGKCKLCNSSINFIIKHDSKTYFKFSPLTSSFSINFFSTKNIDFLQLNTIILFEKGQLFSKSDAILGVFQNLDFPFKYLYYLKFIPKVIRDLIYNIIAKNRYSWFGKNSVCMIPSVENLSRFL